MAKRTQALCRTSSSTTAATPARVWTGARRRGRPAPAAAGAAGLRRREVQDLHGHPGQAPRRAGPRAGSRRPAPFADDVPRSVADIDSAEAFARVREWKKAKKAGRASRTEPTRPQVTADAGRLERSPARGPRRLSALRSSRCMALAALAVEPAEQDGDGPGVVAQLVAGAVDDAQLGGAVGVGQDPGVERGHRLVVGAVHDEQRAGAASCAAHVDGPDLRGPRGPRRRTTAGTPASWMRPTSRACCEQPAGVVGPVVEVGRRAPGRRRPGSAGRGPPAQMRQRAAGAEPGQPHAADVALGPRRWATAASTSSSQPRSEKSPVGLAAPPEGEDEHHPAQLGGDAVGQLGERRGRAPAAARGPAGSRGRCTRPGTPAARRAAGPGEVAGELDARREGTASPRCAGLVSSSRRVGLPLPSPLYGLVAPVAGLGERVGPEAGVGTP